MKSFIPKASNIFLSIKWKTMLLLTLLLASINGGLSWLGYSHLDRQFASNIELIQSRYRNNFNGLLEKTQTHFQNLTDTIALIAGNSPNSEREFATFIDENWELFQLDLSMESAGLFEENGELDTYWGSKPESDTVALLISDVIEQARPRSRLSCEQECFFLSATPLLLPDGSLKVLLLSTSLADIIIGFSKRNLVGIALLGKRESGSRYLNKWGYEILAITDSETNSDLLLVAENEMSMQDAFLGGWIQSSGNSYHNFHALSLTRNSNENDNIVLLLFEDVTAQRTAVTEGITQIVIASTLGMILSEICLVFLLWRPLKRITRQAKLLPLLAEGGFQPVRYAADNPTRKRVFQDELDVLEEATLDLSNQLDVMAVKIVKREEELQHMALYDNLTGLANRRLFLSHLEQASREYYRSFRSFAILYFDLDYFKKINDSLGHDAGDEVLITIANRLKQTTRTSDMVGRIGGDEFTILLMNVHTPKNVVKVVNNIFSKLKEPIVLKRGTLNITFSIGIALAPKNGLDSQQLLKNADLAMYEVKKMGRNNYYFYSEDINREANRLAELEIELRRALDNDEFEMFYQPVVDLSTSQIVASEALVRWNDPEKGMRFPDEFIPVMENNGMIMELGRVVIKLACQQLAWLTEKDIKPIVIAINLSAKQLKDVYLERSLIENIQLYGVNANYLKLEITESSLMEDVDRSVLQLNQLKALGLTLSIDDFGTGYSSLSYLKKLPVDELKIDRSFIMDIPDDIDDMEITAAVIAMAHKLGLQVVAEGIETAEQRAFLVENNCDLGQGYLFQRPIDAEKFGRLLENSSESGLPTEKLAAVDSLTEVR